MNGFAARVPITGPRRLPQNALPILPQASSQQAPPTTNTTSGTAGDHSASVASSLPGSGILTSAAEAVPVTPPEREIAPTPTVLASWAQQVDIHTFLCDYLRLAMRFIK